MCAYGVERLRWVGGGHDRTSYHEHCIALEGVAVLEVSLSTAKRVYKERKFIIGI